MRTGVTGSSDAAPAELLQKGRDTVADALTYLTSNKVGNFYARIINLMDRIAIPGFGTMGVSVQDGRYIFIYDPVFASKVTFEEICATCEHEVLHILLEHIPRSLMKRRIFITEEDLQLFDMTSNLGVDAAANELLGQSWPKIKDQKKKPLGMWILPESFDPPMPRLMAYEDYQHMLIDLLKRRLTLPPQKLYKIAQKILENERNAIKQAFAKPNKPDGDKPGEGKGEDKKDKQGGDGSQDSQEKGKQKDQQGGSGGQNKSDDPNQEGQNNQGNAPGGMPQPSSSGQPSGGQGDGQASGQGGGQPQPGQGQGDEPLDLEALKNELKNLDPVDAAVLEMLVHSMRPHLSWQLTANQADEGEAHKLAEHGRELVKSSLTNHEKSRGTLPGHIMELIRKMLTPPVVPWTEFLHNIVQRTRQTKKERGMSRPSKKLAAMKVFAQNQAQEEESPFRHYYRMLKRMPVFPGVKRVNKFTIVFYVDTSGSMSFQDMQRGLAELQHIQKSDSDVSICVVYIDTNVTKEYWIGPTDELDYTMTGRGGTDFEPAFQHCLTLLQSTEKAPDILVYATDGYCPPPQTRVPIPCVWLITPRGVPVCADSGHITIMMKDYQLEDADV